MEFIIRAIVSKADKDELNLSNESKIKIKSDSDDREELEKKEIKKKNENEILSYLRNLIENEVKLRKEEKNVHNLYIYQLSKSESSQDELIDYLKIPLNNENLFFRRKETLFQLDYDKKLLRNNPEA